MLEHASKLVEATFYKNSERLDTVDIGHILYKLVVAMEHPVMVVKTHIHKASIATPAVSIDHGGEVYFAPNNTLQSLLRAVRHNLGIHFTAAFKQAEDNGFAIRPASLFTAYPVKYDYPVRRHRPTRPVLGTAGATGNAAAGTRR